MNLGKDSLLLFSNSTRIFSSECLWRLFVGVGGRVNEGIERKERRKRIEVEGRVGEEEDGE